MLPEEREREKELRLAIIEACREVKRQLSEEPAGPLEETPELAHYRQSLGAGLSRLQGKWKETLEPPSQGQAKAGPSRTEGDKTGPRASRRRRS